MTRRATPGGPRITVLGAAPAVRRDAFNIEDRQSHGVIECLLEKSSARKWKTSNIYSFLMMEKTRWDATLSRRRSRPSSGIPTGGAGKRRWARVPPQLVITRSRPIRNIQNGDRINIQSFPTLIPSQNPDPTVQLRPTTGALDPHVAESAIFPAFAFSFTTRLLAPRAQQHRTNSPFGQFSNSRSPFPHLPAPP